MSLMWSVASTTKLSYPPKLPTKSETLRTIISHKTFKMPSPFLKKKWLSGAINIGPHTQGTMNISNTNCCENHCPILGWWCSWRKWEENFHKNPLDKENQTRNASLSSKLPEQICHNRHCPRWWSPLLLTSFNGGRTYSAVICYQFWQCYTIFIDLRWQDFISASLDHLTWLLHGARLYILMVLSNSQWSEQGINVIIVKS